MSTQVTLTIKTLRRTALLATLFATAALTACGGGGDSTPAAQTPISPPVAPAPAPPAGSDDFTTRQPVTSVPAAAYFASSFQLDAFNRLNALRASVGLGLFTQNASLDVSAQAHGNYTKLNGIGNGHLETSGLAGFTGVNSNDRMIAAGYSSAAKVYAENMAFTGGGASTVDNLVNTVYHRIPFLQYKIRDIGIGYLQLASDPDPQFNKYVSVFDMSYTGTGQGAPAQATIVWPADNSTTTSISMPNELPRPGTPGATGVFGYPVSISTDEDRAIAVTSFTLTDNTGASVLCNLLSYVAVGSTPADPELVALNAKSFIAIVPRDPLKAATTYTVQFVGSLDGVSYSKTWSFKTP